MKQRIKEAWDDYHKKVIPKNASRNQITETRRAFYAGAQALFTAITTMLEPGQEATDADLAKMDEVVKEFRDFANDIRAGRA